MNLSPAPPAPVIPGLPIGEAAAGLFQRAEVAMKKGLINLAALQEERGSWAGDYGGPVKAFNPEQPTTATP